MVATGGSDATSAGRSGWRKPRVVVASVVLVGLLSAVLALVLGQWAGGGEAILSATLDSPLVAAVPTNSRPASAQLGVAGLPAVGGLGAADSGAASAAGGWGAPGPLPRPSSTTKVTAGSLGPDLVPAGSRARLSRPGASDAAVSTPVADVNTGPVRTPPPAITATLTPSPSPSSTSPSSPPTSPSSPPTSPSSSTPTTTLPPSPPSPAPVAVSLVNTYPQAVRLTVNGVDYALLAVGETRAVQVTPGPDSDSVSIAYAGVSCSMSGRRYFASGHGYRLTVSSGGSCGGGAGPTFTVDQL